MILIALILFLLVGAGGGVAAYFYWPKKETEVVQNAVDKPPVEAPPVAPGPNPPDAKPPGAKGGPKAPGVKIEQPHDLALRPASIAGERRTIPLPGQVTGVCAGAEGRFLFLHCPNEKKLVVFDTCQAGIVTELPTTGLDTHFAAGATKLLLTSNSTRRIQRFDLLTLRKDKEGPFPFEGQIAEISLGAASAGPALILSNATGGPWPVHFVDPDTLGLADVGWEKPIPAGLPRDLRFQAAAYGTKWVGVPRAANSKDLVFVGLDGKALSAHRYQCPDRPGYAALSADGAHVYSRFGAGHAFDPVKSDYTGDDPTFVAPGDRGRFLYSHREDARWNLAGEPR